MGHDMYVWPLRAVQPGSPPPPKDTAVAHLRMSAAEGRHSPIYEILDASSCNKIDSGNGSLLLYRYFKKGFNHIKDRARQYQLSKEEQEFIETIHKTVPQGFAVLFE